MKLWDGVKVHDDAGEKARTVNRMNYLIRERQPSNSVFIIR